MIIEKKLNISWELSDTMKLLSMLIDLQIYLKQVIKT